MNAGLLRIVALLWAVAFATWPGVLAVADAPVAAAAFVGADGHVESESSDDCSPAHTHACAVCTVLRVPHAPPPRASHGPAVAQPSCARPTPARIAAVGPVADGAARPRAPPVL